LHPTIDWAHVFFPLERPTTIDQGDCLSITLDTHDGDLWRWQVEVTSQGHAGEDKTRTVPAKIEFDHSTFRGFPLSQEDFLKGSAAYKPRLSRRGEAQRFLLNRLNGELTIPELEKELLERYGDCFPSSSAASAFIGKATGACT
jgi:hypothetical protein